MCGLSFVRAVRAGNGGVHIMERNGRIESDPCLYYEKVPASSCGADDHGFRCGVFYQSEPWDVANLECAVCDQPVYAFERGNSDDHNALCFYPAPDPHSEKGLSSDPAYAASGGVLLRISDGLWRMGSAEDLLPCILAAVDHLPDRDPSGSCGSQPGSKSRSCGPCGGGRGPCDLQSLSGQVRAYEGGI